MAKIKTSWIVVIFPIFLWSCSSNEPTITEKDGKVKLKNILGTGEKIKENREAHQIKRETRIKNGDTLCIPFEELAKYLPEIPGYAKKGEPKGEIVSTPMYGGWSKTKQEYKGADGGYISVELFDYNQSSSGFSVAFAAFGINMQVENDREKAGSFDTGIPDVKGFETLIKKSGRVKLLYAISDRFFLQLNGRDGVTAADLKKVASSMALSELASK